MTRTQLKKQRHELLLKNIKENPFLKDDELANLLGVSVATIRFDRAELGIAEYRERVKIVARDGLKNKGDNQKGEVLDLNILHDGISILQTDDSMAFDGSDIIKGQHIFAFAENLAISVIGVACAMIKVANVKYILKVISGDRLVAKSEVKRIKDNEYIVWVKIKVRMNEVFRAKFNLIVPDNIN